jgi:hypothetical protein
MMRFILTSAVLISLAAPVLAQRRRPSVPLRVVAAANQICGPRGG